MPCSKSPLTNCIVAQGFAVGMAAAVAVGGDDGGVKVVSDAAVGDEGDSDDDDDDDDDNGNDDDNDDDDDESAPTPTWLFTATTAPCKLTDVEPHGVEAMSGQQLPKLGHCESHWHLTPETKVHARLTHDVGDVVADKTVVVVVVVVDIVTVVTEGAVVVVVTTTFGVDGRVVAEHEKKKSPQQSKCVTQGASHWHGFDWSKMHGLPTHDPELVVVAMTTGFVVLVVVVAVVNGVVVVVVVDDGGGGRGGGAGAPVPQGDVLKSGQQSK